MRAARGGGSGARHANAQCRGQGGELRAPRLAACTQMSLRVGGLGEIGEQALAASLLDLASTR